MRTPPRALAILIAAIVAIGLLAGCGDSGSGGADADPQEVLDNALGGGQQIDSGVLDLSFDLTADGETGGNVSAALTGPFQSGGEGALPQLDLSATATSDAPGQSFNFDGGLTITPDGAFINYNGEDYALDDTTFSFLKSSYEQSSQLQSSQEDQGGLQQFGVDPATWVTNLTNEGTEDLDGTEVVHVSGNADVAKIIEDLSTVAEQTGQSSQINAAALSQVESAVQEATIDVYSDSSDDTLRKLDLNLSIADPSGGSGTVTVAFSVGISNPNEEQTVTAPADPKPFADLQSQLPAGGLGALGGAPPSGGGAPPSGGASGGGGAAALTPEASQAYFDCIAKAADGAAVEACAKLLGG